MNKDLRDPDGYEEPKVDESAKEELYARLHELEDKVAVREKYGVGAEAMADLIQEASAAYDEHCQTRHEMGNKKYGPVKFMEVNSLEEAMAEVVDLGNYARYTFIRLYLLNVYANNFAGPETFGPNQFVANSEKG